MHIAGIAHASDIGHGEQGNIKMAVSEVHASRWDHKDIIVTTKQIWGRCLQQRGRQVEKTNVKYDLQASSGNTR